MLSTEQERHRAAATVDRLTSMGLSYREAAAVARTVIGDVLVDLGFCDRDTVEAAARAAREAGVPIGKVLHDDYDLPDRKLAIALGMRFGMRYLSLEEIEPDADALDLVPVAVLRRLDAVPVAFTENGDVLVVLCDPRNQSALDELGALSGHHVSAVVVTRDDLDELLRRAAEIEAGHRPSPPAPAQSVVCTGDGLTSEIAHALIASAIRRGDIADGGLAVSYRVDVRISVVSPDGPAP
ncbi:MAG TPA: hypothetical protein VNA28_04150 [Solirubrobacteraceae bacterium]|nr:hypothetical protein [Solirubrobacteraceae bacterium]